MRRRAVCLSVVIALILAAVALAMSPSRHRWMARARADVARQFTYVRLPQGAKRVRHDPSVDGLHLEGRFCLPKYTAWAYEFWRVPGRQDAVFTWIEKHPPRHNLGYDATGDSDITVPFKSHKNVLGQTVDIQLGAARGGGTAVRVDSEVFVNPPPHTKNPCPTASY